MATKCRVTLSGNYEGVEWANVFHYYTVTDNVPVCADLVAGFYAGPLGAFRAIMNVEVNLTGLHAVAVPDDGDYADAGMVGIAGTFGTSATRLPANWTNNLVLNTTGSVIRHGYKHFVGVDETAFTDGEYTTTFANLMNTAIDACEDVLDNGSFVFTPIIARYSGSPPLINQWTPITGGYIGKPSSLKSRRS